MCDWHLIFYSCQLNVCRYPDPKVEKNGKGKHHTLLRLYEEDVDICKMCTVSGHPREVRNRMV